MTQAAKANLIFIPTVFGKIFIGQFDFDCCFVLYSQDEQKTVYEKEEKAT